MAAPVTDFITERWLNLDDFRTVIRKNLGGIGAAEDAGQINDLHTRERAGIRSLSHS